MFSTNVYLLNFFLSTKSEVLSSACDKQKIVAKNRFRNSNLDDSVISLPFFLTKSNPKLHNISVTLKLIKKVITNLDLSKASDPDCVPALVLKSYEPEISHILAKLLSTCFKECFFLDF